MVHTTTNDAKSWYDNLEVNEFFLNACGDEFNHIGIYEDPNNIQTGGLRATQELLSGIEFKVPGSSMSKRVLDIGSGYGGTARYLADLFGCSVDCVNVSTLQNTVNQRKNDEQKLNHLIQIFEADFAQLPFADATYDVVIAQDCLLDAVSKERVFREVHRVLKPQGLFVMSDLTRRDESEVVRAAILQRKWGLGEIVSTQSYLSLGYAVGFQLIRYNDFSENLAIGYADDVDAWADASRQMQTLSQERRQFEQQVFQSWCDAGKAGYLCLSYFRFRKIE
ncbi:MAG: methyltransferase domain-containing protein [Aphanocapsa sp. GSE-SYN-MK-11-07L]|jgi:sarcosine/dimethylglycine N-methyltransferase|nr:methyltransferase domain-containing protein [Aphanocapsa sp. GSE-SYN-MK-11-07L]